MRGSIEEVLMSSDRKIKGVKVTDPLQELEHQGFHTIHAPVLILAVGPYLKQFGKKMNVDFPVMNELHSRVEITDPKSLIPQGLPFMIWSDNISLPWSEKEMRDLQHKCRKNPQISPLLHPITVSGIAGAHLRPLSENECGGKR